MTTCRYDQRILAILDSEVQRLATLYDETTSQPVRDALARRASYVDRVAKEYTATMDNPHRSDA